MFHTAFPPWRVPMMCVPVSPNSFCTALARSPMVEAGLFCTNRSPGLACPERKGHKVHGFVQAHQEAGHLRVGDGDGLARFDLVDKQGDNAAAAGHDVAVAGAADGGSLGLDGARLRADNFSIIALLIPMALMGYAALSVERQTTFLRPRRWRLSIRCRCPARWCARPPWERTRSSEPA